MEKLLGFGSLLLFLISIGIQPFVTRGVGAVILVVTFGLVAFLLWSELKQIRVRSPFYRKDLATLTSRAPVAPTVTKPGVGAAIPSTTINTVTSSIPAVHVRSLVTKDADALVEVQNEGSLGRFCIQISPPPFRSFDSKPAYYLPWADTNDRWRMLQRGERAAARLAQVHGFRDRASLAPAIGRFAASLRVQIAEVMFFSSDGDHEEILNTPVSLSFSVAVLTDGLPPLLRTITLELDPGEISAAGIALPRRAGAVKFRVQD